MEMGIHINLTLIYIHEQDPPSEILAKFWNFKLVPKVNIRHFAIENFDRSGIGIGFTLTDRFYTLFDFI